jgi:hypothetical protein
MKARVRIYGQVELDQRVAPLTGVDVTFVLKPNLTEYIYTRRWIQEWASEFEAANGQRFVSRNYRFALHHVRVKNLQTWTR